MEDNGKTPDNLKKEFTGQGSYSRQNGTKDTGETTQFYAVGATGALIECFDLILRPGQEYSIPYALLPVFCIEEGSTLFILAYELRITVKGRNLYPVRDALKNKTLIWIRESTSQKDDDAIDVFVSSIELEGKIIEGETT